jgi:hypothetical protein
MFTLGIQGKNMLIYYFNKEEQILQNCRKQKHENYQYKLLFFENSLNIKHKISYLSAGYVLKDNSF